MLVAVVALVLGWALFAVALSTEVFSGDRVDDQESEASVPTSAAGNADSTIDAVAIEEHLAAVDGRISEFDARIVAADQRIADLEAEVESAGQSSPTTDVPYHDHLTPPIATFPHVWTGTGNSLPEHFLQVRLPEGVWHFELEAACLGDLSSCPRPGDRSPALLVRDLAEDPLGYPDWIGLSTEWCEAIEAPRELDWRLWMTDAQGVTWSLRIDQGECSNADEYVPGISD